ncbi:MAG: cupin domain-containing protein [Phycisphaerales bacterium]|nr:cupin domain-containing protein [Phycisphaerales bacterium]
MAAKAIVLQAGEGERLSIVGDVVRVLVDGGGSDGRVLVFEETVPPGGGPPLHRHGIDDEYFYILEGTFTFVLDGKRVTVGAGAFVTAPKRSLHTFMNSGATPGRLLVMTTPAGLEAPFREAGAMKEQTPSNLAAAFAKFELSFEGPPLGAGA